MKKLLICLIPAFGVCTQASSGEFKNQLGFSSFCKSTSLTLWGRAHHPGGDRGGKINEQNDGLGLKCFRDEEKSFFYHFDSLENSKFGKTFTLGMGKELSLIQNNWASVYVGGTLTFLIYEVPQYQKNVYAILPIPYYGIKFSLPNKFGSIGIERILLPQGIKMDSIRFEIKREF